MKVLAHAFDYLRNSEEEPEHSSTTYRCILQGTHSALHLHLCLTIWFCVSIKNFHSCNIPCNSLFNWIFHNIQTTRCFKFWNDLNELISIQFCESSNYKSCEWGSTSRQRRTTWKNKTEPLYSSCTSWGFLAKVSIREWVTEFSVSDTRYENDSYLLIESTRKKTVYLG